MDAAVLLRVLPGDWRPQVVAPRMLEMDQEGRLALKVGHERADAEQVEDVEVVLDEEDVAAEIFVVGDSAVEDFPVEEIIVEDAAVDDAVVDDAVVEAAAVENAIVEDVAVDDAIVEDALEDAVEENATVDDTAAEDTTTEDEAGPADVTAEDAAEDDGFDEAEESGGLLYSRTSSVLVQTMTFSIVCHPTPHSTRREHRRVRQNQNNLDTATAESPTSIVLKHDLKGNTRKTAFTFK